MISEKEQWLADNPNIEQVHTSMAGFGDGMRMNVPGVGKGDSTFEKYIINRIAETVPGNTIKQRHKTKGSREW